MYAVDMPGFFRRLGENVLGNILAPVVLTAVAGALTASAVFLLALRRRFDWIGGPVLAMLGLSVFLLVLALCLSLLPRIWTPRGPFGRTFGTAALMMGISEERNKLVFQRAPELRRECQKVAKQLRDFAEKEAKKQPQAPGDLKDSGPERTKFNADMQTFLERFNTLYHNSLRPKLEPLLADARAMFFGPVPITSSQFMPGQVSPQEVRHLALALDRLSDGIPEAYTDAVHSARVERLTRLKRDGLGLAADLGSFMIERHHAAVALQERLALPPDGAPPIDAHAEWQRNVNFSSETEAIFAARYGGSVLRIVAELHAFGLTDENLERILAWGGHALRVSSYDLPGLAGVIASLCQRIPYD
jgi:hypothetical protein